MGEDELVRIKAAARELFEERFEEDVRSVMAHGVERSDRLGRHRWVVERTLAWLARFRRLTIRYERRADIHWAFTSLACSLICLNQIKRFC